MKKHLAIMNKATIEAVLSGKKTVETRFSKNKIAPFGCVSVGDLVYIKPPGDEITGQFRVKKVFFFEGLTSQDFDKLFAEFGKNIKTGDFQIDQKYEENKKGAKFATLIFITNAERFITSPIKIKKSDQRGWMVLD